MKTALIFPGQGSQYIGMGHDFYLKYKEARGVYEELDELLKNNISKHIFEGNEQYLSLTQNSQPSIMATSFAIYSSLKREGLIDSNSFHCVAGHSLGEYSALVVNNCLAFQDSVKLLKVRSKAMQESMPSGTGGMVALIGCNEEVIDKVIAEALNYGKIYIANDNAAGQIVLSGEICAIEFVLSNSKKLNIKRSIKLPVSAPFHCELIQNARDIMSKEIPCYKFNTFSVPLYSNVTAKICDETEIEKLLIEQIISKVRWRETMENMLNDGYKKFIEIGPGNVLTSLVKRTSKDVTAISISKLEDLEKLASIKL